MVSFGAPADIADVRAEMHVLHEVARDNLLLTLDTPMLERATAAVLSQSPIEQLPHEPKQVIEAVTALRLKSREGIVRAAGRMGLDTSLMFIDHEHLEVLTVSPGQQPPKLTTPFWHPDTSHKDERLLLAIATYTAPGSQREFHHAATQWIIGSPTTTIIEAGPSGFIDYADVDRRTEQQLRSGTVKVWPDTQDASATNGQLLMDHATRFH